MSSPKIPDSMRVHLGNRAHEYHSQLRGTEAEKYLTEVRKISPEAIDFFNLGYVETPMKGDQSHQGRIVVPYQTRTGVVALRSVSVPTDITDMSTRPEPKCLPWMTGDVTRPYNTTALDTAEEVYIVEGEPDTWTAWMLGLYVVGIPGVNNWKGVFKPLFRYRKVTIIADNDDMGQGKEFAKTIAQQLGGCSIIMNPKGHDLNSFYAEAGKETVLKHILGDLDD